MPYFISYLYAVAPAFCCFFICFVGVFSAVQQISVIAIVILSLVYLFFCKLFSCPLLQKYFYLSLYFFAYFWTLLFLHCPWQTYLNYLPREECHAELLLRISESSANCQELEKFSSGNYRCYAKILFIRTHLAEDWKKAKGKVIIQTAYSEREILKSFSVGEMILAEGNLLLPPAEESPAGYYRKHLQIYGIKRIFILQKIKERTFLSNSFYWKNRRNLQTLRCKVAARLISGFTNIASARMFLALSIGMQEFLPASSKNIFIRSGTVHIFSISGLHVGMIILIVEFCLRLFLPALRLRRFLLLPFLLAYVFLAGISPSILRAFYMAILFFYAHWRMRPASPLNALGFSGFLALLLNPLYVMHSGFIYSYTIVFVLINSWPLIKQFINILQEKKHWISPKYRKLQIVYDTFAKIVAMLLASFFAWLASAGLSLSQQGVICFSSALVNLPLASTVFLILAIAPVKVILSFSSSCSAFINVILNILLQSLAFWAECGNAAKTTFTAVPLNKFQLSIYYLCLIMWMIKINEEE